VRGGGRDPVWCSGLSEGVVEVAVISELYVGQLGGRGTVSPRLENRRKAIEHWRKGGLVEAV
jgi:hypothetical protein